MNEPMIRPDLPTLLIQPGPEPGTSVFQFSIDVQQPRVQATMTVLLHDTAHRTVSDLLHDAIGEVEIALQQFHLALRA